MNIFCENIKYSSIEGKFWAQTRNLIPQLDFHIRKYSNKDAYKFSLYTH